MKALPRRLIALAALAALVFLGVRFLGGRRAAVAAPPAPAEFALIPAGPFTMGDTLDGDELAPPHEVTVSAFLIQRHEVTKAQWDEVRAWGLTHGYPDLPEGTGVAPDDPVGMVTWYEAVKWCNARSEKDGLVPCYYTDAGKKRVYRQDAVPTSFDKLLTKVRGFLKLSSWTEGWDLDETMVRWDASGYRLPTEAEWEKAARGGLAGKRFPWGDTISHREANFKNDGGEPYQRGDSGCHREYFKEGWPAAAPVGNFPPSGYGLHDMVGNVAEWCWDCYGAYPAAMETDPRRPARAVISYLGLSRVLRGGRYCGSAKYCRVSYRSAFYPAKMWDDIGFRPVRR